MQSAQIITSTVGSRPTGDKLMSSDDMGLIRKIAE